ncbi:MAG TPA: hypothetical protein PLT87_04750 [Spirochaetales bacterium]|nr:hypothetical protein [Spirochaetales bacterium]
MAEITLYRLHLQKPLFYAAGAPTELDSIRLFGDDELVVDDEAQGPKLATPLPEPLFAGGMVLMPFRTGEPNSYVLPAQDYVFCQWSQDDFLSVEEGLESFVRQVWWEQRACEGPWILRSIREEKGLVFQGLRAMKEQGS